ncbi:MAG: aldo/keto reductase [Pseudogulbenkiania sp.]|nr:aldo/keto reductase [Pseudogulbenkiania sp.]
MSAAIGTAGVAEGGPMLSPLVAGMWRLAEWQFSAAELDGYLECCLELGISSFDHADLYGDFRCEALFGAWLKAHPTRRDEIQLVTKCGIKPEDPARGWTVKHYDTGRAHILASVDNSLRHLGTDYLDLLLIHRPDPLMDPDEVAEAFATLKDTGKVRHFGVSNFSPSQFALLASRTPLVTNQVEASLRHLEPLFDGSFDQCLERRIRPMLWSPLAGGRLFDASAKPALHQALTTLSEELGVSPATLALAWLLHHPARPLPIVGSRRLASLHDAARAATLSLERQHWFALLEAAQGHAVP